MRVVRKQICYSHLRWLVFYFVCCCSFCCRESCSGVNSSVSARTWADWRCCLQTFCFWQRQVTERWANQLVPTSLVAKKHSIDRQFRAESTDSVMIFHFPPNPRLCGKENILVKTGPVGDQWNGVIFQPLLHCLIGLHIIMTKFSQKCLVSL